MCSGKLVDWHHQWQLQQGTIVCRACLAVQTEHARGQPFPHLPNCLHADNVRPWDLLDKAVADT